MTSFIRQKITISNNLGDKLKEARTEQSITLDQATKDLNIAFKYLSALENNKLSDIPGEAYLKNFLKLYCEYLNLKYNDCWLLAKKLQIKTEQKYQGIENKHFFAWSRIIRKAIVVIIILAVLFFLVIKIQEIFSPPILEIIQPSDDSVVTSRQIELVGRSEPEIEVIVNNRHIFVDDEGKFKTNIDLQKGLNLIKITAKKRYSQLNEVEIRVLLTDISQ